MQKQRDLATGAVRNYASVPLPRSAYRMLASGSPWMACDPQFQGECSAAVRAFRLILFALFAIFIAPLRSRNASAVNRPDGSVPAGIALASDSSTIRQACVEDQEALNPAVWSEDPLRPLIRRPADEVLGYRIHLVVKRSHGPPLLHKTATQLFLSASPGRPLSRCFPQDPHSAIPVLKRHSCRRNPLSDPPRINLSAMAAVWLWRRGFLVFRHLAIDFPEGDHHHVCC